MPANSNFNIDQLTVEVLEKFRLETDTLADDTVAQIIASGSKEKFNEMMMNLFRSNELKVGMFESLGTNLSKVADDYITKTSQLPDWADRELIQLGERVFEKYGPEVFMLLNVSSLPMCYTCAKGAQVLFDTGRLLTHNGNVDPLARRLMETAQMIFNVMQRGGLSEKGAGVITIQKVRLIHASIRYYLKNGATSWDVEEFGEPINQEDLAGTLMSFGPVILAGLKKLNVRLTDQEQYAYMHCWKVVGYLMGIRDELLPDSYEDGYELATKILVHQADESEAGIELTKSCIAFINSISPGNVFNELPNFLMNHFLEEFSQSAKKDLSACIGITSKADTRDKVIFNITKFLIGKGSKLEENAFIGKISSTFNRLLLRGIIHHFNDGKRVQFNIPPSLRKNWKLDESWQDHKTLIPNLFGNRIVWQKESEEI